MKLFSTVLRKCLVLASRLGHQPLKSWAQWELDGYPDSIEVPDYRILYGLQSFGHFLGLGGASLQDAPLSTLRLPEVARDDYANPKLRQGVRAIAEMIKGNTTGVIRWAWPAEAYEVFNHEGYRDDLRLMQAWISVPAATLAGLLDTIRNRVLSFALELETLGPKIEEETPSEESKRETAAQITQTFNQTIYGPVSNVGTAGSISQTMTVAPGDFEALKTRLEEKGLPEADLNQLEKAIKADEGQPKPSKNRFGENVGKWVGDMSKKVASELIMASIKLLENYYGIG